MILDCEVAKIQLKSSCYYKFEVLNIRNRACNGGVGKDGQLNAFKTIIMDK